MFLSNGKPIACYRNSTAHPFIKNKYFYSIGTISLGSSIKPKNPIMKKLFIVAVLVMAVAFQFCTSTKKAKTVVVPKLTYEADIKPLIAAKCSPCHIPPEGRKEPLNTFTAAYSNIGNMITRIHLNPGEKGYMPFKKPKLTDSVIHVFEQWKMDGLLEK
jgi:hypothetical protein